MKNDGSLHTKFLTGPGDLGKLILAFDWSQTPLGPISVWPQSLKTAISLMLSSRQPMWIGWGPAATFLYNDAYIGVLSASKHPWALGRPAAEVWSEIWDICGPLSDIVFKQGDATVANDVRLFMSRGNFLEETYYSFSYSPIRDESGNVAGLFCPNLDVTDKHLNARRLHTLSDLATKSLVEKTVQAACASVVETLACNPDDIPFSLLYLTDAQNETAQLKHFANLNDIDAVAPASVSLTDKSDRTIWPIAQAIRSAQVQVVPVQDIEGLPLGLANQRITEAIVLPLLSSGQEKAIGALVAGVNASRKLDDDYRSFFGLIATQVANAIQNARTAEEEKMRVDMLAEIDRAKTSFFSNVSHEFRTPLTLMLGPIEEALADEDNPLPSVQHGRVVLMQRNALRLQKLVNTLLEFSRIQAGRVQATFVQTDLSALTIDLASSFRSTIEHAGMQLLVDCPPLPETYYVDPSMWEKIILNLLSNAFKFTFEGSIRVTLRSNGTHATIAIADTGIGIPENELPRLFERFHRIEGSRARTHEGSGIGLALVQDLVALHGGEIRVDSKINRGTTFMVTIPAGSVHLDPRNINDTLVSPDRKLAVDPYVAEAESWIPELDAEPEISGDADAEETGGMPSATTQERILVADDNLDMRAYLRHLLQPRWQVKTVTDGREALNAARRWVPDIIISDVMMPQIDGFELLTALRSDSLTREVPFILLSARAGEEARVEGLQAGADEYLVKPFSGKELIARVDSLLMRRRIRSIENAFARRMQSVFAQAPVAIAITRGPAHVFEQANPNYLALIGNRDVVGLPVRSALPELEGQNIYELIDSVYQSGVPFVGRSMRVMIRRGVDTPLEECFFNFVCQPLIGEEGATEGIAIVCFEVSELVNAQRAAESANRAKDEFLAMLGHELRNPLAPIVTALQVMRLHGISVAEKERAIIERQAQHLVSLVDDLLDVSRVAQGNVQLRKRPVEASEVIAKAIETASPLLEEKLHKLTVEVPTSGLCVNADPERLAQVIANLLTNAAKYTEKGGHIHIQARREMDEVRMSVRDNGIGIANGMLPTVFDMFVQERQALSRSQGGLGLGLAIAKSMTTLHDGTIHAESEGVGMGSTFSVRIPAMEKIASDSSALSHEEGHVHSASFGDGMAILIVDDNEDGARMLSEALALSGHRTKVAFDGPSAMRIVQTFKPDIGLLDIGLPGMDGYELALQLRQQSDLRNMRLFAITGYGQETDREKAIRVGFNEHVVKPVDVRKLELLLRD